MAGRTCGRSPRLHGGSKRARVTARVIYSVVRVLAYYAQGQLEKAGGGFRSYCLCHDLDRKVFCVICLCMLMLMLIMRIAALP